MSTALVQEPQTGDVEHVVWMEIGRRVQYVDSVESQHRIEFRAAAKQAHEKEEKKRSSDSSIGGGQKTIAKLEEQLKAARNENKRLAARTQFVDKSKESDGAIESVDDEKCAADLDELQTLVDLSNKYFPDSVHNATLREKLDVERKKKQDAGSDHQCVETIGEKTKSESGCGSEDR